MSSLKLERFTEEISYLCPVFRETRTAEETTEAIIPEYSPDIAGVLRTGGTCFLRGRELREGGASVSVGVRAAAMCRVEGRETPEVVEVYLPITVSFDAPDIRSDQESLARVALRQVDGHMISARKVLVRATVAVTLEIWEHRTEDLCTGLADKYVECLEEPTALCLPGALAEKRYTLEDTAALTPPCPGGRIADYQVRLSHGDARLTGARAVFQGTAEITALCMTEEGQLQSGTANLPFSQYMDLEDCQEGDPLSLDTCLTGAELELTAEGSLRTTLQLQTSAQVWCRREITTVADLYSLRGTLTPTWETRALPSLLDLTRVPVSGQIQLPGESGSPVWLQASSGELRTSRSADVADLHLTVAADALLSGEDGWEGRSRQGEATGTVALDPGCTLDLRETALRAEYHPGGTVLLSGSLTVQVEKTQELRILTEADWSEAASPEDRPGLVIRRTREGETLWDISKQYRTTRDAIAAANDLQGQPEAGTLLLIPGA